MTGLTYYGLIERWEQRSADIEHRLEVLGGPRLYQPLTLEAHVLRRCIAHGRGVGRAADRGRAAGRVRRVGDRADR